MLSSLKLKAIFFLALLAGHEAARIRETARLSGAALEARKAMERNAGPASKEWRTANHACHWSTLDGGCMGPESGVKYNSSTACAFRYLPLDYLPPASSQGCRFTDAHMLNNGRSKYFQLQARLLNEKAKKFAANCDDASMLNLKCVRRAKHMFRALTFMSKAQDSKFVKSLSEEQKASDKALFEDALDNMKVFAGEEAEYVMMLKDKMKARNKGSLENVQEIVTLLTKLLRPTDASERDEARAAIKEMSQEPEEVTAEDEARQKEIEDNLEARDSEVQELLEKVIPKLDAEAEDSAEAIGKSGNSSALMQNDASLATVDPNPAVTVIKSVIFFVIVMLLIQAVVWGVLFALVHIVSLASLVLAGCVGYDYGKRGDQQISLSGTATCIANVFAWPIKKGASTLKYIFDELAPWVDEEDFQK